MNFAELLKGLHFSTNGFSMTKFAASVIAVAGLVVCLPTMGVAVPVGVLTIAKIIGIASVKLGIDGLRNGVDKNGPVEPQADQPPPADAPK